MSKANRWPRQDGKCVEKFELRTDAGLIECRVYRLKLGADLGYSGTTRWLGVAKLNDRYFSVHGVDTYTKNNEPEPIDTFEKRFRAAVTKEVTVTWAPYLQIEVSGSSALEDTRPIYAWIGRVDDKLRNNNDLRLDLSIAVHRVEIGVASTGEERHRSSRTQGRVQAGRPTTGIETARWHGKGAAVTALVPDTEANRAALEALRAGMHTLTAKLLEFLHPDRIEHTLANAGKLLPAPAKGSE